MQIRKHYRALSATHDMRPRLLSLLFQRLRTRIFAMLCAVAAAVASLFPSPSAACSYPTPPTFAQALGSAETVAVVRIESARLKVDRVADDAYMESIETNVRVVETVHGQSAKLKTLIHLPGNCGGIRLDPGAYLVVALRFNEESVALEPDSRRLLDVSDEYRENDPDANADAGIIPLVRSAASGGALPVGFPPAHMVQRTSKQLLPPSPEECLSE